MYIQNQHKSVTFDGISTKIVTDSGPSIKRLIGGLIRDAPDPPNPPYGGAKVFLVGYDRKTMLTPIKSSIIGKLLTSNLPPPRKFGTFGALFRRLTFFVETFRALFVS